MDGAVIAGVSKGSGVSIGDGIGGVECGVCCFVWD